MVEGQLQREGEVIHVIVRKCCNYSKLLRRLAVTEEDDLSLKMSRADEKTSPVLSNKEKKFVQGKIFGEGRNFR